MIIGPAALPSSFLQRQGSGPFCCTEAGLLFSQNPSPTPNPSDFTLACVVLQTPTSGGAVTGGVGAAASGGATGSKGKTPMPPLIMAAIKGKKAGAGGAKDDEAPTTALNLLDDNMIDEEDAFTLTQGLFLQAASEPEPDGWQSLANVFSLLCPSASATQCAPAPTPPSPLLQTRNCGFAASPRPPGPTLSALFDDQSTNLSRARLSAGAPLV